jgi:heterodisulfide reductase subunit A2
MKKVVVIGGGVAGMESSAQLASMGYDVTLIEKQAKLGGHVDEWDFLFPNQRPAWEIIDSLKKRLNYKVEVRLGTDVQSIIQKNKHFSVHLSNSEVLHGDALLLSSGFDLFEAKKKEEYGHGIYNSVITAAELEKVFGEKKLRSKLSGNTGRIGIVHCVGSRDEKVGNEYCSKVCCVTGVKQAIRLREALPEYEVFNFYMDLRMFGRYFEDLYREAQEKWGVQFIRGRVSEASEDIDGNVVVKVEDTLAGRPMKISVDLLVLLTGFVPSGGTRKLGGMLELEFGNDRFLKPTDEHLLRNHSNKEGVFVAGACTGPRSIGETITDARAAALEIAAFFRNSEATNE